MILIFSWRGNCKYGCSTRAIIRDTCENSTLRAVRDGSALSEGRIEMYKSVQAEEEYAYARQQGNQAQQQFQSRIASGVAQVQKVSCL